MMKRELSIFLIVGTLSVLVDFSCYHGLLGLLQLPIHVAKGGGFIAGTLFAYFANRYWTFGHKTHPSSSHWRFALLYTLSLAVNIAANSAVISLCNLLPVLEKYTLTLAFLVATCISATLNFVGMKWFVFHVRAR